MRRALVLISLLVASVLMSSCSDRTAASQNDKPAVSSTASFKALLAEYNAAQAEFSKAYAAAKTDQERQQAFVKKSPPWEKYARQFLALAEKNPKDPSAVDALVWVAALGVGGAEAEKALMLLRKEHVKSEKIGQVCQNLGYSQSKEAELFLRDVMAKNPARDVQAQACFALACLLKRKSPDEADKLFNQAIEKYGDVKRYSGTLADSARGELFELHNLAIGKVAPDIEGQDVEGKSFKLSDYRGKVVVLDFFGDW